MAADDLFDLDELDEIINSIQTGPRGQRVDKNDSNLPKRKPRVSSSTQNVKSTVRDQTKNDSSFDFKDLDDLIGLGDEAKAAIVTKPKETNAIKCYPSCYVTNSNSDPGVTKHNKIRTCSTLRCTSCDFTVVYFDRSKWKNGTAEYIFLRNNHPNKTKLRAQITADINSRAFCCQCSSMTITRDTKLSISNSTWICGKHQN